MFYFDFLRHFTAWRHTHLGTGLLRERHLLLVWEVKAINAGILDCAGAIFLNHIGKSYHILHRNWRLSEINFGESIFKALLRKEFIECPSEAVAELNIVWEVEAIDERVLEYSQA